MFLSGRPCRTRVEDNRIYVDHGLTGTNRERPDLREALAACRESDTLVVPKLDRLARSLPDASAIADELTACQVRLNLCGSVYDGIHHPDWCSDQPQRGLPRVEAVAGGRWPAGRATPRRAPHRSYLPCPCCLSDLRRCRRGRRA